MPRVPKTDRLAVQDAPDLDSEIDTELETEQDAPPVEGRTALVEIPLSEPLSTSFGMHVELRLRSGPAQALRRAATALDQRQARLTNGRRVVNATTAVLWILEQLEQASV